jgi:N-acetylneuraminate synthase/N,N'-diacetyllegionaminate synthase
MLIDAAAECGADAIQFQTCGPDQLFVNSRDSYQLTADKWESPRNSRRSSEFDRDMLEKLKVYSDSRRIIFLSTPFDEESTDFLDSLGVPAFKIASADLTHIPLLRHVASKKKPVLLSTGMAFMSEVADAIWALKAGGTEEILLLHSVSSSPAPPQYLNLRVLQTMQSYFELPVGLSDHSEGILFPPVAVALGAVLIEKHFTLEKISRHDVHGCSIGPEELKKLVTDLRKVEVSLGDGRKRPSPVEEDSRLFERRSVVAAVDIRADEKIAPWMLAFKRPGSGLEPRFADKITGMTARRNIDRNTILQWEDLVPSVTAEFNDSYFKRPQDSDMPQEEWFKKQA